MSNETKTQYDDSNGLVKTLNRQWKKLKCNWISAANNLFAALLSMDRLPLEILSFVLWYCVPAISTKRTNLVEQIWPVLATCRQWHSVLTDPGTIPIRFGQIPNLGLILHIIHTKLTEEQFSMHFTGVAVRSAFFSSYNSKKWLKCAPFLIPQKHNLLSWVYDYQKDWWGYEHNIVINEHNIVISSCKTADAFFHLYSLFNDMYMYISLSTFVCFFKKALHSLRKGDKRFQLKHLNWFYNKLLLANVIIYEPKIYSKLICLGFSCRKIRVLFKAYIVDIWDSYHGEKLRYKEKLYGKPLWMLRTLYCRTIAMIHYYGQVAYRKLAQRKNISIYMFEILFYEKNVDKIMSTLSSCHSGSDLERYQECLPRYLIVKNLIKALKRKWKN